MYVRFGNMTMDFFNSPAELKFNTFVQSFAKIRMGRSLGQKKKC